MLSDVFLWFMVGFLLIGICVQGRNFVIPHGLVFNINYLGEYDASNYFGRRYGKEVERPYH